jgi:hypothetical protein
VPVRPEPEQQEVELDAVELVVVLAGGIGRLQLTANPVHVGLLAQPVEQRLLREPVVRALVVGRHRSLVAPPDGCAAPVGLELRGLHVRVAGAASPGEDDRAAAARLLREQLRDRRRRLVRDVERDVSHGLLPAPGSAPWRR